MSDPLDSIFVSLSSRDFENQVFQITIIQIEITNVFGRWTCVFYIFVGAPTGPDPRRAPPGPRGGPRGGPRAQGPGPRAQGRAQGPMRAL